MRDMKKYGVRGTVISVSDGYALGFLLPHGYVAEITGVEGKKILNKTISKKKRSAEKKRDTSAQTDIPDTLTVSVNANEKGVLFQSVSPRVIARLTGKGVTSGAVSTPTPIKTVGEHIVFINGKKVTITVKPK